MSFKSEMYRNMLPVQFQVMNANYGFPHFLLQLFPEHIHIQYITMYMHMYMYMGGADISTNNFNFNRSWNTGAPESAPAHICIYVCATPLVPMIQASQRCNFPMLKQATGTRDSVEQLWVWQQFSLGA